MDRDELEYLVDERTNKRVVRLKGNLLLTNVEEFKKPFVELLEKDAKEIVFDLRDMKHIDSSGIGLILLLHRKLAASGRGFALANLQKQVASIFTSSGLDKVMTIFEGET